MIRKKREGKEENGELDDIQNDTHCAKSSAYLTTEVFYLQNVLLPSPATTDDTTARERCAVDRRRKGYCLASFQNAGKEHAQGTSACSRRLKEFSLGPAQRLEWRRTALSGTGCRCTVEGRVTKPQVPNEFQVPSPKSQVTSTKYQAPRHVTMKPSHSVITHFLPRSPTSCPVSRAHCSTWCHPQAMLRRPFALGSGPG